jgi:hypothetical protein
MRRVLLAAVVGLLALPAPASATTPASAVVRFELGPGVAARVGIWFKIPGSRIELVRAGRVVAAGEPDQRYNLYVRDLVAGDVANIYLGGQLFSSATYDGTPTMEGACAGRSSFTFTRAGLGQEWRAGLMRDVDYPSDGVVPLGSLERTDGPLTIPVTLPRPLRLGDYAYAATRTRNAAPTPTVLSSRIISVDQCPVIKPAAKPKLGDAARKLRKIRRGTLARAKRIKLPMTYSEPGTYRVRIVAGGGRTLADGSRTRTRAGKANVTLTVKRRAALKRAKRVTLRATFTPTRDGVKAPRSTTTVRLRS